MKKGTELKSRLALVLKKDDLARIKVVDEEKILVDLHNLGTKEAMILVNNIINLNRNECEISVIHGYNHGIALIAEISSAPAEPLPEFATALCNAHRP